ncbi:MAG: DUF167 domain-containing protein [Alphaproteobacteria bacterium]|nr:DUF167 domain-containing protein [Alphaproteobacteria bacterium]
MKDLKKIFNVRVIPHAKQNKIVENDDVLRVYTTTAPEKGKANGAVIDLLSDYFKIPKSKIKILKGDTSRDKIIGID